MIMFQSCCSDRDILNVLETSDSHTFGELYNIPSHLLLKLSEKLLEKWYVKHTRKHSLALFWPETCVRCSTHYFPGSFFGELCPVG
jgi:hypothetical protein